MCRWEHLVYQHSEIMNLAWINPIDTRSILTWTKWPNDSEIYTIRSHNGLIYDTYNLPSNSFPPDTWYTTLITRKLLELNNLSLYHSMWHSLQQSTLWVNNCIPYTSYLYACAISCVTLIWMSMMSYDRFLQSNACKILDVIVQSKTAVSAWL